MWKLTEMVLIGVLVLTVATVNFPMQTQSVFIVNNGVGNYTFQPTYSRQFMNFTQPVMVVSMTLLRINTSFNGSIVPSLSQNLLGWMLTLTVQGDWNTNVAAINLAVSVMQNNSNSYQPLLVNLTAATTVIAINPRYNATNCQLQMYLLGWHNIVSSKFANCAVTAAGQLTCTFIYDPTNAVFLYYSIIIVDNQWYELQCPGCSLGYVNITNYYQYFAKPLTPIYRYFYGFRYIGAADQWVSIQDIPTMISLGADSYNYQSSIAILMLPPFDTVNTPSIIDYPETPIQGLSGGAIAGIVVGSLAAVSLLGVGIYCWKKKKDQVEQLDHVPDPDENMSARTDSGQCLNCMMAQAVKLKPCGHQVLCKSCVENVMMMAHECPMCGRSITGSDPVNNLREV